MLKNNEILELSRLLKKIPNPNQGLPQPVFDALSRIVVFPGCEVVIVNQEGHILLTYRKDKFCQG